LQNKNKLMLSPVTLQEEESGGDIKMGQQLWKECACEKWLPVEAEVESELRVAWVSSILGCCRTEARGVLTNYAASFLFWKLGSRFMCCGDKTHPKNIYIPSINSKLQLISKFTHSVLIRANAILLTLVSKI
jgi:hypothetical protein